MNEFSCKLEKDFSMVSFLSSNIVLKKSWYVDNEVSRHMTSFQELFSILIEHILGFQVKLGDDAKYLVVGFGTIPFQL